MEMNMTSIIEHDELVVDLGAASVETKGAGVGNADSLGTEIRQMGIADD